MKKLYFILLSLISIVSYAQPTVTSADLPVAGLAFTMGTDDLFNGNIPSAGANQNWNLSNLINRLTDTTGFISAVGTPYAATFSSSNLAAYDDSTNTYSYFTSNSNGFFINGVANANTTYMLTPGQCFVPTPFTFGDQFTNVARNSTDTSYTDSTGTTYQIRNVLNITSVFNADAYGTLTLPNGVLNNTLRVKITETTYDSLFTLVGPLQILLNSSASQKTYYRWFQPGNQAGYVLGITADSLGTTANYSEYLLASIILNVPDETSIDFMHTFPNPANDYITLQGLNEMSEGKISIFTTTGKVTGNYLLDGIKPFKLDVSNLNNGIYFISIESENERKISKFIVSH